MILESLLVANNTIPIDDTIIIIFNNNNHHLVAG